MKITYYGTGAGAGIPEMFCSCRVCEYARRQKGREIRTRSQATVDGLMIDFSLDVFAHCAFYGLDLRDYRHVLITHPHIDHFVPSDLTSRYQDDGEWTFYLPAPAAQEQLKRMEAIRTAPQKQPPRRFPNIEEIRPFETLQLGDASVTPLPSNHAPAIGSVLYMIRSGGKALLWAHDSGLLLPETLAWLQAQRIRLDAVSLDCTLKRGYRITAAHMDILQCAETMQTLRALGCADDHTVAVLSHIGHLSERTHEELVEEAKEFGFLVAYDTMELNV